MGQAHTPSWTTSPRSSRPSSLGTAETTLPTVDVADPTYAEAYEEMRHYSENASRDAENIAE